MPLVSVIMPVYNGEQYLAEAIESILTQTFADFEFIIVDDASTDGSAAIIDSYAKRDKRIRPFQHERRLKTAGARNTGLAATAGECVAFMDCDDISLPERLEKQLDYLESHPRIGGVGVACQLFGEDLMPMKKVLVITNSSFIAFNLINRGLNIASASMMVRREYLEASGGFCPDFTVAEDFELFMRMIWETRIRYSNVPEVLYLYRQHETNKSNVLDDLGQSEVLMIKRQALEALWGEVSDKTFQSLDRLYPSYYPTWVKLSLRERRQSRHNMYRLIDSMIAANWAEPADRIALREEVDKRIEKTMPRRWQQFLHWRRHRLGF